MPTVPESIAIAGLPKTVSGRAYEMIRPDRGK
jgi:hypothetical protein